MPMQTIVEKKRVSAIVEWALFPEGDELPPPTRE